MSNADGYINSQHKIVDHGPDNQRFNIVILGDGYRAAELGQFATDTQTFVDTLRATAPYNDLWCGINVYRIDVVSTDSGADDPGTCGDGSNGSGATPRTYFDATFCGDGQARRLLTCDSTSAKAVAVAQVPRVNMTMVIVNSSQYGGSGGDVAVFSTNPSSAEIGLHEMGHTAFGFADEVGHPHEARIDFMDNRVDPQTGTLKVRVVVKNEDGKLTPGLFARVRASGLAAGNLRLTANYFGGVYTLSGSLPGMTLHAQIANEILALLNQTYNTKFALVDVGKVASGDPAVRMRPYLPQGVTK